jgi:putative membrane protein
MFFLLRLLINAVALLITAWIIPGIHLGAAGPHPTTKDWVTLLIVALIFGLVNAVIRPILILLSLPLEILTLGLFIFVINAFMLLLTSWIAQAMGPTPSKPNSNTPISTKLWTMGCGSILMCCARCWTLLDHRAGISTPSGVI